MAVAPDFVMLSGMLAGHDECEGEVLDEDCKVSGCSSAWCSMGCHPKRRWRNILAACRLPRVGGKDCDGPYREPVKATMQEIVGGVRSMMTYIGATKLKEVAKRTTFVRVSAQLNTA
jgi:GMP reductase